MSISWGNGMKAGVVVKKHNFFFWSCFRISLQLSFHRNNAFNEDACCREMSYEALMPIEKKISAPREVWFLNGVKKAELQINASSQSFYDSGHFLEQWGWGV